MTEAIQFQSFQIVPEQSSKEINFTVYNGEDYLFRLVPGLWGFELSKLDKALNCEVDQKLIDQIGGWIAGYFA